MRDASGHYSADNLPDGETATWRQITDEMRKTRGKKFLRVSRKMLNHLCSIGLKEAQQLLAEVDNAEEAAGGLRESNIPGVRLSLEDSLIFNGAPFELAAEYLGDDEILDRLNKWLQEDKASFFSTVVGDMRATMPEIAQAIRRYDHVLSGRSGLPLSTLKSLRVSLIQRFLTEQLDFINVAKEVVRITDFMDVIDRVIMTQNSHGKLGGKAAGLLLAGWILDQPEAQKAGLKEVKTPRTWHILSDAIIDFVKLNQLDDVMEQKFKEVSQVRREYPNIIQMFKNSTFPIEVVMGMSRALDYFGDVPLIIRSSSLLEDRFGTAFSGKYKSLFLANQGSKEERLEAILDAIAEVWASVLGPDPIEYRRERGLQEFVEEMGILIQEVIGTRVGDFWLPAFAGVCFSQNEFRWSPRINRDDGLIRMVPGLGTRAVDRVGNDFPVLAVPGQPGLRASQSLEEELRYSPHMVDVINLKTNKFETIELANLLKESGSDYPLVEKVFSVFDGQMLVQKSRMMLDPENDDLVANMEGLLKDTVFISQMDILLKTLAGYLKTPVDIEFAHDGKDFYLLQCRPQAQSLDSAPTAIPRDIDDKDVIFTARRFVSNGWVPDISHIVYVVPEEYGQLNTREDMLRVGQAVGKLNRILPKRKFVLLGPGRWGSRGDIKLGVSITYADINNTAMLIEVARKQGDYVPDLSFGTHFFQDLVEANIRYLPLYPDDENIQFNDEFFLDSPNTMQDLLPKYSDLAHCIRVLDVSAVTEGKKLRVFLNADQDEAMAALVDESEEESSEPSAPNITRYEPRQFWRWRFRMAERMVRTMDHERFGVAAVYLHGTVKNGTAGPDSDINLLVHFTGSEQQKSDLNLWFEGWSLALVETNFSRTGVKMKQILDITYLSSAEVASGAGLASKIGAVTDAARLLDFS